MDTRSLRGGQAFVEMAFGMLALALVLSALFAFTDYIVRAQNMQRRLRAAAGLDAMGSMGGDGSFLSAADADMIEVEPMAAAYVFGTEAVKIEESVYLPALCIDNEL